MTLHHRRRSNHRGLLSNSGSLAMLVAMRLASPRLTLCAVLMDRAPDRRETKHSTLGEGLSFQQLGQLGDVARYPPRLILSQHLGDKCFTGILA